MLIYYRIKGWCTYTGLFLCVAGKWGVPVEQYNVTLLYYHPDVTWPLLTWAN